MANNKNNSTRIEGSGAEQRLGVTSENRREHTSDNERIENFGALELDEQVNEVKNDRGTPGRMEEGDEGIDDEESDTEEVDFEEADVEEDLDDDELDEDDFEDEELDDNDDLDADDSYTDYGDNSDTNRPAK